MMMLPLASRFSVRVARRARAPPAPLRAQSSGAAVPDRKLIRFRDDEGTESWGQFADVLETHARVATRDEASGRWSLPCGGGPSVRIETLLPPVDPLAIFCIGLNYRAHAAEVGMPLPERPLVFSKTINALTGHGSAILLPRVARDEVDYEAELAVVIGREALDVPAERALDFVLGYTIANDVTARRWQGKKGGGQWLRAKSFDTFLPLGPFLVPAADVPDPQALRIQTWVNDQRVQDGNTSDMVFSVAQIIAFLSQDTTLLPGTLILTGTPAGVGYTKQRFLRSGDSVRIEIEGLGALRNTVAEHVN